MSLSFHKKRSIVASLRKLKSIQWANEYFDLLKETFDKTGLRDGDPRLCMSITKDKQIPVIIGQRYILWPGKNGTLGIIMPLDYSQENFKDDGVIKEDPGYFFRNRKKIARWILFDKSEGCILSEKVKQYWIEAIDSELKRSKISGHLKNHKSIVYQLVVDMEYRNRVLKEALEIEGIITG